ncbi:MAG: trypsin-like serine protease [Opitutales bacterium]|nr:trypsin-like serine protease [Opitutales bacterium]
MRIKDAIFLLIGIPFSFGISEDGRRLGKLEGQDWYIHAALGENAYPYSSSTSIPDFSPVGALVSEKGTLGTATLIAPNLVITAAHVLKNSFSTPMPRSEDWEFILYPDFESANIDYRFKIDEIIIHPYWVARQSKDNPLGDGDKIGVDLALLKLKDSVSGVFPARLPHQNSPSTGQKIFISGFGNLVEGENGEFNPDNSRRMAGTNILDRVVKEIVVEGNKISQSGGLLALDFDSPEGNSNSLSKSEGAFENLPTGTSGSFPLELEVSTASGDSGGPLFARIDNQWRVFGTVSYGSSDSTYGDITVFSRIFNHLDWIGPYLPPWPSSKMLNESGWTKSDWFGVFLPFPSGWNYHVEYGWVWSKPFSEDSVWAYFNHLGWLWVTSSTFPFFYSNDTNNWLFFYNDKDETEAWVIYDFASTLWSDYTN